MSRLRVLSLFSGIGGLDLGLERAGMEIIAHSEVDPYACKVLAKHWPGVPNLGDITAVVDWPEADVIAGGFPCQDISLAGKGAGINEGTRSGLWFEYARCVRDVRPRYVIVENVAALLGRGLDRVLGDLAALGYDAWWDCVPAAAVGAPHRRDRVFLVATRSDVAAFDTDIAPMQWAQEQRSEPNRDTARTAADCDSWGFKERTQCDGPPHESQLLSPFWRDANGLRIPLADTDGSGSQRWEDQRSNGGPQLSPVERGCREPASHWSAEPGVGRVADGIPRRVDRLRCLGNAVVPQVAEYVGRLVVEHWEAS